MHTLTITDPGLFLGKHSERLVVKKQSTTLEEHPLVNLEQVLVASRGVSISADLIQECCERGIPITFLAFNGKPYAKLVSPALLATVKTRREQILSFTDARGVEVGRAIVEGKLHNQANLLRYFGKYRKERSPQAFTELSARAAEILRLAGEAGAVTGEQIDMVRTTLLNIEGRAAAAYWEGVRAILGEKAALEKRQHRGSADPVNAALNYGYGILYSQVWTAVTLAGLEPFAGFLHVDRPGKPSLVLDLVEEFRQPVVDRALLAAIGKGFSIDMETPDVGEEARLTDATRKELAARVLERLAARARYQGKQWKMKSIIQMQSRHLASVLRGETAQYQPYPAGW